MYSSNVVHLKVCICLVEKKLYCLQITSGRLISEMTQKDLFLLKLMVSKTKVLALDLHTHTHTYTPEATIIESLRLPYVICFHYETNMCNYFLATWSL